MVQIFSINRDSHSHDTSNGILFIVTTGTKKFIYLSARIWNAIYMCGGVGVSMCGGVGVCVCVYHYGIKALINCYNTITYLTKNFMYKNCLYTY